MNTMNARRLWAQLCCETVGATQENEIESITRLGSIATSADLPLYIARDETYAVKVAAWLESWAQDIRGPSTPKKEGL